jgi:DNA polymerase-1
VHDELVIESPVVEVDSVAKIIDAKMEKIHKLCVPLNVDTKVGNNWAEMEKIY